MYLRFPSYKTTDQKTKYITCTSAILYDHRHLDDHIATSLRNICENPLKNIKIGCIILTSFYLVTSFKHLDQKSYVGAHNSNETHTHGIIIKYGNTCNKQSIKQYFTYHKQPVFSHNTFFLLNIQFLNG